MAEKDFIKRNETLTPLEKALLVALTETQFGGTLSLAAKCASDVSGVSADKIIRLVDIESEQRRMRMTKMAACAKEVNAFMGWGK